MVSPYKCYLFDYSSFNKLTERHYEKSPWPDADYVASVVDGGETRFKLNWFVFWSKILLESQKPKGTR